MIRNRFRVFVVLRIALAAVPITGIAQPISFSPSNVVYDVAPGASVSVFGTVTNQSGGALDASDFFFEFTAFDPTNLIPTQILGTTSDFPLPNDTTSPSVDLFTVGLAPTASPGTTYSVDVLLQDINGDVGTDMVMNFVATAATQASVDEPGIGSLALAALFGLAVVFTTRRRAGDGHLKCDRI